MPMPWFWLENPINNSTEKVFFNEALNKVNVSSVYNRNILLNSSIILKQTREHGVLAKMVNCDVISSLVHY